MQWVKKWQNYSHVTTTLNQFPLHLHILIGWAKKKKVDRKGRKARQLLSNAHVANPRSKLTDHHETGFYKHPFHMHSHDSTNPTPTLYGFFPIHREDNKLITEAATPQYTSRLAWLPGMHTKKRRKRLGLVVNGMKSSNTFHSAVLVDKIKRTCPSAPKRKNRRKVPKYRTRIIKRSISVSCSHHRLEIPGKWGRHA